MSADDEPSSKVKTATTLAISSLSCPLLSATKKIGKQLDVTASADVACGFGAKLHAVLSNIELRADMSAAHLK
jgi:hypothetical protein